MENNMNDVLDTRTIDIIEGVKIIDKDCDLYGAFKKSKTICDFLALDDNKELLEKNNLIAIYGKWGTGKSSLMRTIEASLDNDKFDTKWFDTWRCENDDNLPYSLFKFIMRADSNTFYDGINEHTLCMAYDILRFFTYIQKFKMNIDYRTEIGYETKKNASVEESSTNEILNEKDESLWEKIDEFSKEFSKLKFGDKRMIVFLDDLDRCESDNIISVICSIKHLLCCNPNIIFLVGIDKEAVTLALRNKYNNDYNKADEYLEKIFPISFSINSSAREDNIVKYISNITDLNDDDCRLVFDFFNKINLNNPRHVKKIFRKYYTIKNIISDCRI